MRVLIIGSGLAGLSAALFAERQGHQVTLVTKVSDLTDSNSYWAQGGIAYRGREDSPFIFAEDIKNAAAGMAHPETVAFFAEHGPGILKEFLVDTIKVPFSQTEGEYNLTKEGAHSHRRILFVSDATGKAVITSLLNHIKSHSRIRILRDVMVVDLITLPHHSMNPLSVYSKTICLGAYLLDNETGETSIQFADRTILATGGIGQIYKYTTNPAVATGDGIALAYRAGTRIVNMEYTQFHPTTLAIKGAGNFLISEAVRGEGGVLVNHRGEDFTKSYHPKGSLAPRDVVSRAIVSELEKSGKDYVFLSLEKIPKEIIRKRFTHILEKCRKFKTDILEEPIPVQPAFHFSCGGVLVNLHGETTCPNLYAIGEVACNGLHGANRLASVALLECVVTAKQAISHSTEKSTSIHPYEKEIIPWEDGTQDNLDPILIQQDWETLQSTLWNYVGIIRKTRRMVRAFNDLWRMKREVDHFYRDAKIRRDLLELRNAIQTAILVTRSAFKNKNSFGCHHRVD